MSQDTASFFANDFSISKAKWLRTSWIRIEIGAPVARQRPPVVAAGVTRAQPLDKPGPHRCRLSQDPRPTKCPDRPIGSRPDRRGNRSRGARPAAPWQHERHEGPPPAVGGAAKGRRTKGGASASPVMRAWHETQRQRLRRRSRDSGNSGLRGATGISARRASATLNAVMALSSVGRSESAGCGRR